MRTTINDFPEDVRCLSPRRQRRFLQVYLSVAGQGGKVAQAFTKAWKAVHKRKKVG